MKKVFIHTGHLSFNNGAVAPLGKYFELARLIGVSATTGAFYGDDALCVSDEDWPTVKELLVEERLLYRVDGEHSIWQNVKTSEVKKALYTPQKSSGQKH